MSQETFERELARRADGVHGAPLSLDDVRGRARSIQRRRRGAVVGTVAAAVALAVIVPSVLGGGHGKGSQAPDPAPPVPGHTAVLHDGTVTLPGGTLVDLGVDTADVTQLSVLSDGRIVLAMQRPVTVRVYDADGAAHTDYPVQTNAITADARGDAVAWIGEDFRIRVLSSGATEPATMAGVPMGGEAVGSIDAVLAPDQVLVGDGSDTTGEVTPDGYRPLRTAQRFQVDDVSPDGSLWAVHYPASADQQFGCSSLYDPEGDRFVAKSCTTSELRFAPDGRHLLGMRGDNQMYGSVEVFDTDLGQIRSWSPGASTVVKGAAWDDSSHLLLVTAGLGAQPRWSLVRLPLGDAPDVVAGPEAGPNAELPPTFLLSD